jgi:hypothetical protein
MASMDRPAVITYVYEYADEPGAVVLKELSPSVEDVLGFRVDDWYEDPQLWQRLLHPEDAVRVIAATWRTTFQGIGYEETYRMISRDSRIVWIRDRANVERLPDKSEVWRGSWTVVSEPEQHDEPDPLAEPDRPDEPAQP